MENRVFIVHRMYGSPEADWYPWLRERLASRGFYVEVPAMPSPSTPRADAWLSCLDTLVGKADERTYFIGHSIGCQAVLRYIAALPAGTRVGGAVLVAPFIHPNPPRHETEEYKMLAGQWLDVPIDFAKILSHTNRIRAIFSDDDPYVSVSESSLFEEKLHAKIIMIKKGGHFTSADNTKELQIALDELLLIANRSK